MGMRNGARIGGWISDWKRNHPLSSRFARILSKFGGFLGGVLEWIAVIGILASTAMKKGPDFMAALGLFLCGASLDVGLHWLLLQIEKAISNK